MKTLRFHGYGEPLEVLRLEDTDVPAPPPKRIRAVVRACGLNPADWALCRGLFAGKLPRGVGLEIAGVVDAIGEGVTDVRVGDRVVGTPDWKDAPVAGASEQAILDFWTPLPKGLGDVEAAALPMAVETGFRGIDALGVTKDTTLLVNGGGTTVGFAAVQIARERGARVIASAGETFASRLRDFGAEVVAYGEGLASRSGPVDVVLDAAPPSGALPELVRAAGGDARRVLTMTDFAAAAPLGVRTAFDGDPSSGLRYDALAGYVAKAAEGRFSIPVARTYALEEWREACERSSSGFARGKLVLVM